MQYRVFHHNAGIQRIAVWLILSAAAAGLLPAEPVWVNGQAGRLFIGQPFPTAQQPISTREILGGVSGIAIAGDRLIVADSNRIGSSPVNNRVLVYNNLSSFVPGPQQELEQQEDDPCPACVGVPDLVLGQQDFESFDPGVAEGLQTPIGVHSDGQVLAVADTNNNRVLLWREFPMQNGEPPVVVLGQPDFETNTAGTTQETMRGPEGVWIDSGQLFVADTQNSRILIWNTIPTSNGALPDVVVGQPDFTTRPTPDLRQSDFEPRPDRMLDPVSVTVNNGRMFVSDLGFSRVLVFLSIPTAERAPADVVIGQPDMESGQPNNSSALCEPLPPQVMPDDGDDGDGMDGGGDGMDGDGDGMDGDGEPAPVFPRRCEATLNFPRFALSDGQRLFIADGGNDRVLVYDEVPLENGAPADSVIGQRDFQTIEEDDGTGTLRAPLSLATDGTNLYVSDPFSRRIVVFTPGENQISQDGVRNAASFKVRAQGTVEAEGAPLVDQVATLMVGGQEYDAVAEEGDTAVGIRDKWMQQIRDDPNAPVEAVPFRGEGVNAVGRVTFSGTPDTASVVTVTVNDKVYQVSLQEGDTIGSFVDRFNFRIANDPNPYATSDRDPAVENALRLIAKEAGPEGNSIRYSVSVSPPDSPVQAVAAGSTFQSGSAPAGLRLVAVEDGTVGNNIEITTMKDVGGGVNLQTSGSRLTGGADAREAPAGSLATIFGTGFSETAMQAEFGPGGRLPTKLGGVQVYCNGIASPLIYVSPDQINFQIPWEITPIQRTEDDQFLTETTSVSVYVRREMEDGSVQVSVPRAAPSTRAAPGLFAFPGPEPRRGVVVHGAGPATGTVAISAQMTGSDDDETVPAGITVAIIVNGREHTYTTQEGDTPDVVRDRLVAAINGGGNPDVTASAGAEGFFSARARVEFTGDPQSGDRVSILVRNRIFTVVVNDDEETLESVRNRVVREINAGQGDPEVTARELPEVDTVALEVVARELGESGNSIPFDVATSNDSGVMVSTDVEDEGTLQGGDTPPVVRLTARESGRQGNEISYSATSTDEAALQLTPRDTFLCCGNEAFSLVTDENPAIPGELIIVFGTGLGLTSPLFDAVGLKSGEPAPASQLLEVPFVADDFVSSLAADKTAQLRFAGLMPNFVGVYQINLKLNEDLADTPAAPLTIAQGLFISNVITFPIDNLRPRVRTIGTIPPPDSGGDNGEGDGGGDGEGDEEGGDEGGNGGGS